MLPPGPAPTPRIGASDDPRRSSRPVFRANGPECAWTGKARNSRPSRPNARGYAELPLSGCDREKPTPGRSPDPVPALLANARRLWVCGFWSLTTNSRHNHGSEARTRRGKGEYVHPGPEPEWKTVL